MARIKTKRIPAAAATSTQGTSPDETQTENPNQNKEDLGGGGGDPPYGLIHRLTSAIALALRFLSDSDLILSPTQTLALSSLIRASATKLSTLIAQSNRIPKLPPDLRRPSPTRTLTPFPWFRRFLAASTSPSDPRWPDNFRMSKPSFYLLLQTLSPALLSNSTSPVPPDVKLAAALFRLAHAAPFPLVARRFGLNSPSLAARSFYESLRAVALRLAHLFELSSDTTRVLQGFNWMSLPNCCGSLSFSLFGGPLFGVLAQCIVDSEGRFLDASVGWHPSMCPSDILSKTKLYTAQSVVLGCADGSNVGGAPVPRYFIGGSCCPLLPWLLTPYQESDAGMPGTLTCAKGVVFNTVHARGMELAERAFRRLKARWKLLRVEWTEECVGALPYVVVASCLLHNFLVKCSEPAVEDGEGCGADMGFAEFAGEVDAEGEGIRDALAAHLSQVISK